MDLTGTLTYFGSPSARAEERIVADHIDQRLDMTVRKETPLYTRTGGVGPGGS